MKAKCPECGSPMRKAGQQTTNRKGDKKQVYQCGKCLRRTVRPIIE